jgi:hypothetical protein
MCLSWYAGSWKGYKLWMLLVKNVLETQHSRIMPDQPLACRHGAHPDLLRKMCTRYQLYNMMKGGTRKWQLSKLKAYRYRGFSGNEHRHCSNVVGACFTLTYEDFPHLLTAPSRHVAWSWIEQDWWSRQQWRRLTKSNKKTTRTSGIKLDFFSDQNVKKKAHQPKDSIGRHLQYIFTS